MARQKCRRGWGCERLEQRNLYSGGPAQPDAIAYGADGSTHVAYFDAAAQELNYAIRGADGRWATPLVVDGSGPGVGLDPSLALDPSGEAGVVYRDPRAGTINYAHQDGAGWRTSVVASGNAVDAHITFERSGRPLVSFYQPAARSIELAELNGGRWHVRKIAKVGPADAGDSGLAVDSADGTIAMVFQTASGLVKYATLWSANGSGFDGKLQVSPVERLAQNGADPAVAFEPSGLPALSYYDLANGQLRLVRDVDGRWQSTTVAASTGHAGAPQLRFDVAGAPQIIFSDTNADLSIATLSGGNFQVAALSLIPASSPAPSNDAPVVKSPPPPAPTPPQPPPAVTDLEAAAVASSEIDLSWSDPSGGVDGFTVQRGSRGAASVTIATLPAGATHYADADLSANTEYTYRLGTIVADGQIAYSDSVDAMTLAPPVPVPPVAPDPVTPAPDALVPVYLDTGVSATNRPGTQLLGYWMAGGSSPDWRALGGKELARSYEIGNQTSVPPQATLDAWADHVAVDGDNVPAVYDMEWGAQMQPGQIAAQVAILQASKTRHPDQKIGLITTIDLTDSRAAALDDLIDFAVVGPYLCTYSGGAGSSDPTYNLTHTSTAQFLQNYQLVLDQQLTGAAKAMPGKPIYAYVPEMFNDSLTPMPADLLQQIFGLLLSDYRQGKIDAIVAYAGFNGTTGPQGTQVWDPGIGGTYINLLNQVSADPINGWQTPA